jgi:hypothetical protein
MTGTKKSTDSVEDAGLAGESACPTAANACQQQRLHHLWWAAGPWELPHGRGSVTLFPSRERKATGGSAKSSIANSLAG